MTGLAAAGLNFLVTVHIRPLPDDARFYFLGAKETKRMNLSSIVVYPYSYSNLT
jgi:hypothetical protein